MTRLSKLTSLDNADPTATAALLRDLDRRDMTPEPPLSAHMANPNTLGDTQREILSILTGSRPLSAPEIERELGFGVGGVGANHFYTYRPLHALLERRMVKKVAHPKRADWSRWTLA